MVYDSNKEGPASWQRSTFRFEVDFGPELKGAVFQEISMMDEDAQVIESRRNNRTPLSTIKMPGIAQYGSITQKHGVSVNENIFLTLMNEIKMNTIPRRTVFIKSLDENGAVARQWQLNNAWPTKIICADLTSDNRITLDTLQIAYEQLVVTNGA